MALGSPVRTLAVIAASLVVLSACGSATPDSEIVDAGDAGADGPGEGCDSAAVAAALAPGSPFDYDPSASPADLAASTDIVFRTSSITSIEIGEDWSTVFVENVETITDNRADPTPFTQFGAFGSGVMDRPSFPRSALDGLEVLVFAHASVTAPGNLVAAIEGFWLQCGDEAPVSVVANPTGEAWEMASRSVDGIAVATAGELPQGDVAIRVGEGNGWRLVDTEPGYGNPFEVAIMTSERGLDQC